MCYIITCGSSKGIVYYVPHPFVESRDLAWKFQAAIHEAFLEEDQFQTQPNWRYQQHDVAEIKNTHVNNYMPQFPNARFIWGYERIFPHNLQYFNDPIWGKI